MIRVCHSKSLKTTLTVPFDSKINSDFARNINFLIPKSMQHNFVNLLYYKLRLFDLTEFIV